VPCFEDAKMILVTHFEAVFSLRLRYVVSSSGTLMFLRNLKISLSMPIKDSPWLLPYILIEPSQISYANCPRFIDKLVDGDIFIVLSHLRAPLQHLEEKKDIFSLQSHLYLCFCFEQALLLLHLALPK
jgi:hypothetical protein